MSDNPIKPTRIIMVGDQGTGKTAMLMGFQKKIFQKTTDPTAVCESYSTTITVKNQEYPLIVIDTTGYDDFHNLRRLSKPKTDVFILCYGVNDRCSYENVIRKWHPELKHFKPLARVILVGTKSDLRLDNDGITKDEGERLCKKIKADKFIECSSKLMRNVDTVFHEAILKRDPKSKIINLCACS